MGTWCTEGVKEAAAARTRRNILLQACSDKEKLKEEIKKLKEENKKLKDN